MLPQAIHGNNAMTSTCHTKECHQLLEAALGGRHVAGQLGVVLGEVCAAGIIRVSDRDRLGLKVSDGGDDALELVQQQEVEL